MAVEFVEVFFIDFSSNSGLIPHLFHRFIEMAWTGSQRQFCNCEYRIFRQCFRTFSVGENEIVDRLTWLSRNPPMISLGEFELFEWSVLLLFFECQTRLFVVRSYLYWCFLRYLLERHRLTLWELHLSSVSEGPFSPPRIWFLRPIGGVGKWPKRPMNQNGP